jgi:D-alanine-D-alanine ligase
MRNIAVIFGGRTVEHDISILTGLHAAMHIEGARVHLVYLNRENKMSTGRCLADIDFHMNAVKRAKRCWFAEGHLHRGGRKIKIDAVLNCCHGGVGENGELAGYFKVAGIPITSCDYISAANMQSKTRTREILSAAGFKQPKYFAVDKGGGVVGGIDFPVIVKPDTLGSSIGISVARNEEELASALELVFEMDNRAIVEEFFENIEEVNCSAMRAMGEVKVSACEKIDAKREFLDYESKYLDAGSGFIKKGREIEEQKDYSEIKELTRRAYELFGACGVVRADFMIYRDTVYLNEINTIPGFLAYHLWVRAGIPYALMLDLLIKQAIEDAELSKSVKTVFKSDILAKNRGLVR